MENQSVVGPNGFKQIIISPFFVKNFQRTDTVHFVEELKNIENRVAWFLAELCKADKGVQKYKRNQRRTDLVRGCLAPRKSYLKPQGMGIQSMGPGEAEPRQPLVLRMPKSCMRQSPGGPLF
jgi:hypothetical protein